MENPVAGTNQTITNAYALWLDGSLRLDNALTANVTQVAGTPYTQLATDYCILSANSFNSATSITLMANPPIGAIIKIKDAGGFAGTNNIYITANPNTVAIDGTTGNNAM